MAYEPELWHELFVMTGGAAATLAGLIFVAVSLNHEHIIKLPVLPSLAAQTLSVLIGLVAMCAVGLTPGQSRAVLGGEILALGVILVSAVLISLVRSGSARQKTSWHLTRVGLGATATVPAVVAGISLLAGSGGGLYWLLLEFITGITVAAYYAWILLIEIRR